MKRAFSLVELSIVLVILGLLVGGVLSGQALIHAAELRAVPTEFNRYYTAANSFKDKYFGLPGDMNNATRFWGLGSAADSTCISNGGAAAGNACDGNGDGKIDIPLYPNNPGVTGENLQFWKQLQLAGLIEGNLSAQNSGANATHFPTSKVGGSAVWSVLNDPAYYYGAFNFIPAVGKNTFYLGNVTGGGLSPTLTAEDAWSIDKKMDDGNALTGTVIGQAANGGWGFCTDNSSTGYNLAADSQIICAIGIIAKL